MLFTKICSVLAFAPALIHSLAITDSIQDADPAQSGYLGGDHGMDPAVLPSFGQLWKNTYGPKEVWYAKTLVYTPPSTGRQILFTASNMNWIRLLDATTGELLASRRTQNPYLQADTTCPDMPNFIGITGTPIIDPSTDTAYFFSKGYRGNVTGPAGVANGIYQFYAVSMLDLSDRPGFPVLIDGSKADNDPTRYFNGGTVLQRPALATIGNVIIGGFGGHCDLFNFTGMVVAVSKTAGVGVTSLYAMEASPGAPTPQQLALSSPGGGRAAIWMSGFGVAVDGDKIYFVTGNGNGHANGLVPSSGRLPLSTLDECVVNMKVSPSGKFSLTDYFEPHEYINLDAADRDFGAAGVSLLDPATFNAPGVPRLAIAGGKTGMMYIMDANNLGGFKQGPGGADGVLQMIQITGSFFGGPGSYPLEGGYVYFSPVGQPLTAYKYAVDPATGLPAFAYAGTSKSTFINTGRAGVGPPTTTSFRGQPGTGIVWMTDVGMGLKAFKAVPDNAGNMVPIPLPALPGLAKFQRPVFGDSMIYVTDSQGGIYALGYSPSQLSCTRSLKFGSVSLGAASAPMTVTCTAKVALASVNGCYSTSSTFVCANSTLPTGPIAVGASFSFPVTWDLTKQSIINTPSGVDPSIGPFGAVLNLYTTAAGSSLTYTISMSGNVVDNTPFINVLPMHLSLGGLVLPSNTGLTSTFTINNLGSAPLAFTGFAWDDMLGGPQQNVTRAGNAATFSPAYTSSNFPAVGATIPAGGKLVVPVKFLATAPGTQSILITIWSNGGHDTVSMSASAGAAGSGILSTSVNGGAFSVAEPPTMNFGTVQSQKTAQGQIKICNSGSSPMTITSSTPPSDAELVASNPVNELTVGLTVPPAGGCVTGGVKILAGFQNPNRPPHIVSNTWAIGTDGNNPDGTAFGTKSVAISANIVAPQLGMCLADGTAQYQYLGCYFDGAGRQLAQQLPYTAFQQANHENGQCQLDCLAKGYAFAGTQYNYQCWCGNTPPLASKLASNDKVCNQPCQGDTTQVCGGSGTHVSIFYDATKWSPTGGALVSSPQAGVCPPTLAKQVALSLTTVSMSSTSSVARSSSSSSKISLTSSLSSSTLSSSSSSSAVTSSSSSMVSSTSSFSSSKLSSSSSSSAVTSSSSSMVSSTSSFSSSKLSSSSSSSAVTSSSSSMVSLTSSISSTKFSSSSSSSALISSSSSLISLTSSISSTKISSSPSSSISSTKISSSSSAQISSSGSSTIALTSTLSSQASSSSSAKPSSSSGSSIALTSTLQSSSSSARSSSSSGSSIALTSTLSSTASSSSSAKLSSSSGSSIALTSTLSSIASSSSSAKVSSSSVGSTISLTSSPSSSAASSTRLSSSSSLITLTSTLSSSSTSAAKSSSSSAVAISLTSTLSSSSVSSSTSAIASPTSTMVGNYAPVGCFAEPSNGKIFSVLYADDAMTLEMCHSFCGGKYQYFGVEYGRECWCGFDKSLATLAPTSDCYQSCYGNPYEVCGAPDRMNMYSSTITIPTPPVPTAPKTIGPYRSIGCWTEATDNLRALTGAAFYDYLGMTDEICAMNCAGFTYWGTEFGGECFCGNSLRTGSIETLASECNIACPGNLEQLCGGGLRLNLYSNVALVSSSSIKVATSSTKTSTSALSSSSTKATTSSILSSSTKTTTSSKMTTSSTAVIQLSSTKPPTSSSTSFRTSTSTTLTSSKTTSSPSSTITTAPQFTPLGCFSDSKHKLKNLGKSPLMNSAYCASLAAAKLTAKKPTSYHYFGLENGATCYAATAQPTAVMTKLVGAKACTMVCGGGGMCGGKKMMDFYGDAKGTIAGAVVTVTA